MIIDGRILFTTPISSSVTTQPPFSISSIHLVENLNVQKLNGKKSFWLSVYDHVHGNISYNGKISTN